jgi:very-short-patch-repair endonuclease
VAANDQPRKLDHRVPRARKLRRDVTEAERKLWQHLRSLRAEGTHFRRQATIGPYFADFASHQQRIVIEVDGGQHGEADRIERDAQRTSYLEKQGYRVLRFWNNDVLSNVEGIMECICAALYDAAPQRPPPLTPPRHASRGGSGTETPCSKKGRE